MTTEENKACSDKVMGAKQINLLVVDDEEYARRALRRLLSIVQGNSSFNVFEASEGQAAIDLLTQTPMDCVLLDVEMPGGEGTEWLPQMHDLQPNAAIIMVTGVHDEERAVDAMKKGALDYLVKGSISPWALQRAMDSALEKVRMRVEIEEQRQQLLIAERHRVMIESLGAACHHLGQPLTIVTYCLDILERQKVGPSMGQMIEQAAKAVADVNGVLEKLRNVAVYRTEPYLPRGANDARRTDERILAIQPAP